MQDSQALEIFVHDFVHRHSAADKVRIDKLQRLGGGAVQENYAVDLLIEGGPYAGKQAWVLRTDSPSTLSISLGRAAEFAVLQKAFAAGAKVPEPLWLHRDLGQLGKDFYLMRRVGGDASGRHLVRTERSDAQRAGLLGQLGASLAAVHSIKPPQVGLEFLPAPPENPALARIAEYRGLLDELARPQPTLEWALRWLELNAPQHCATRLVHGDFRTGNYMVEGDQLTGILDWEFAGWSAPDEDIGWFCARCWRFGAFDREAGGIGALEDFLNGYEQVSDVPVDRKGLAYWRIMATLRWAIIALLQAERHLSGEQPSLELALTGRMLPEIELDLLDEISALEQERRHA
jgi:aminoglycoside phosphotransferase (APT) family kinase protein